MRFRGIFGLAAILSITLSAGCSLTNPTFRGQNPDVSCPTPYGGQGGPIVGSAPGYGDLKRAPYLGHTGRKDFTALGLRDNNFGYECGYYAGPQGYFNGQDSSYGPDGSYVSECDECDSGHHCPRGGCRRCGRGCGYHNGMPQHVQSYQYNWPQNQVYPTQGVPSGMVQYPYYTLRGPTDFFMQ